MKKPKFCFLCGRKLVRVFCGHRYSQYTGKPIGGESKLVCPKFGEGVILSAGDETEEGVMERMRGDVHCQHYHN